MRFCRMLLGGGTLDGVQVLSPKSVALYSTNLLPGGRTVDSMYWRPNFANWNLAGTGYSVCCAVTLDVGQRRQPASVGEFCWHGAAATHFWVDPREDLAVVFMTQLLQAPNYMAMHRRTQRALVYGAMSESQD